MGRRDEPESVNADAGLNSSVSIAPVATAATDRPDRIFFDMTSSVVGSTFSLTRNWK